jgi:hypothetical protein
VIAVDGLGCGFNGAIGNVSCVNGSGVNGDRFNVDDTHCNLVFGAANARPTQGLTLDEEEGANAAAGHT